MAKEYIQINGEGTDGVIAISTSVLRSIASYALEEEEGICLNHTRGLNKAVSCTINKNVLSIELEAKVDYGYNVSTVCEAAQNRIRQTVYQMTGITPADVDINVVGFNF